METVNLNQHSFFELPEEWKKSSEFFKVPRKPTKYENYNCINKEFLNGIKTKLVEPRLLMIVSFFEIYDSLDRGLGDFLLENPTFTINSDTAKIECPISKKIMTQGDKVVLLRYVNDNTCNYFLVSEGSLRIYMDKNYVKGEDKTEDTYLTTEQFYGEIILNPRWSKEIYELREKKDKFKEEILESIEYLNGVIEIFDDTLFGEINV